MFESSIVYPITKSTILEDVEDLIKTASVRWNGLANKRVLIRGASEFLPVYLVETLLHLNQVRSLDIHITALIRRSENYIKRFTYHLDNPNLTLLLQDDSKPIKLEFGNLIDQQMPKIDVEFDA